MIYDKLSNIGLYLGLGENLDKGLQFIKDVKSDIEFGSFWLNDNVKVMVTEYMTKAVNELGYESHRQFIDIQFPICGRELIRVKPIEQLTLTKPYDTEKDVMFYNNPTEACTEIAIGEGYFTVLFPDDGHEPQHFVGAPETIKKITLKIRI